MPTTPPTDPHLWLEEVLGEDQLAWVREQNARTDAELAGDPEFADLAAGIRDVLDSDDNIPFVRQVGDHLYNFWQDAAHERGIWRRTTMASYRADVTEWETLLDLDALSAAEGETWVWHGAALLRPTLDRALVSLSRGGADADVTRELDLTTLTWVEGGFERPEAKGEMSWVDRDRVLVSSDFGPGTTTESGYPRVVKEWHRGTPLAEAVTVFEAAHDDMGVWAWHDSTPGFERDLVQKQVGFFTSQTYLLDDERQATRIEAPDSADVSVHREWLLLRLRDDWDLSGMTYVAGSLLAARLVDWLAGDRRLQVLFEPTEASSLESATFTRHRLVLNVLEHVRHRLTVLTPPADGGTGWTSRPLTGAPELGTVTIGAVDSRESDDLWMVVADYLTPTTLALVPATADGYADPEVLRSAPAFFDPASHVIEQHFATSRDGTRVPYFLVRPTDLVFDGTAPTILYGYGGFEVSRVPAYSGTVGRSWLARGGVYAVANIRGGGEYGPRWHRAALREKRHRAYEDFAAVARDLTERKVTSPEHLGAMGGSNGGLLVGNMLVSHPDLFGALVIQVPLLDMARYHLLLAGASWVAEYGHPEEPSDWEFLSRWSPYQLFDEHRSYPPTFIWTTTRDDRVHPGHARKMAAKMLAAGADVRYFENIEGGHGAGATNAQTAHTFALQYRFLWEKLT